MGKLKVMNWNVRFITSWYGKAATFLEFLHGDFCYLLEEITPENFDKLKRDVGSGVKLVYSFDHCPYVDSSSGIRQMGVVLVCSKRVKVLESGVVAAALLPERTLWATIEYEGKVLKLLASHALAASSFYKAKALQFDTLNRFIEWYQPDLVLMDANDPQKDSYDIDQMVFSDLDRQYGHVAFFRAMRNQGMVDAYVKAHGITEDPADGAPLAVSYQLYGGKCVRYDFIFVKDTLPLVECEYHYEKAVEAGSDHAIVLASFRFPKQVKTPKTRKA